MSNPESFIQEVTEEVRRDRLYGLFRKYGWIGAVVIVGIVGGTAVNEWLKLRSEARAEAFGDAVLDAVDLGEPGERLAALTAIPADGRQVVVRDLIAASDPDGATTAALATLDGVIADASAAPEWRDLAVLRRVMLAGADQPLAERRAALEGIAVTGRPYRALAAEQLAYLLVEEGKLAEAAAALTALATAEDATGAMRDRVAQVATMLGGGPSAATAD